MNVRIDFIDPEPILVRTKRGDLIPLERIRDPQDLHDGLAAVEFDEYQAKIMRDLYKAAGVRQP